MAHFIKYAVSILIVCATLAPSLFAQRVIRGAEPAYPPAKGSSILDIDVAPEKIPASLEGLVDLSPIIVEGYVQTVFTPWIGSGSLQTDVLFLISHVVKGKLSTEQIIVRQMGGVLGEFREVPSQYAMMQVGEHYLLFLSRDSRADAPPRSDLPRFWIVSGGISGMLRIDVQKIHVNQGVAEPFRQQYEGMPVEQALAAIGAHVAERAPH